MKGFCSCIAWEGDPEWHDIHLCRKFMSEIKTDYFAFMINKKKIFRTLLFFPQKWHNKERNKRDEQGKREKLGDSWEISLLD